MTSKINVIRFLVFTLLMLSLGAAMAADPVKGRAIYGGQCAGCHGVNGLPQVAEIPNFTMGQGLMKSDRELMETIKKGKGIMPAFQGVLSDEEILDVLAHIRTFF